MFKSKELGALKKSIGKPLKRISLIFVLVKPWQRLFKND